MVAVIRKRSGAFVLVLCGLVFCTMGVGHLIGGDVDQDGLDDAWELAQGYNPAWPTRIIYVDGAAGDDVNSGLTALLAKQTIAGAIAVSDTAIWENVILVAPGTYRNVNDRNLDFGGYDVKLRSAAGASFTIIDLYYGNLLLSLGRGESSDSWLDGFTLANVRDATPIVVLNKASLSIRNCSLSGAKFISEDEMWYYGEMGQSGLLQVTDGALVLFNTAISDCTIHPGANLVYAKDSHLRLERSRLEGNDTGYSDIVYLDNSWMSLVNSSVLRNNARSVGGVIRSYGEMSTLSAINCTIAYNTNGVTAAFNTSGDVSLLNTIVLEAIVGGVRRLDYCCTADDCSDLGTGNFQGDPKLSRGGFLMPDSPCIDTGRLEGAPLIDIVGHLRPFGSGNDVGCEEFADADADGLSDYYEAICGGDLNPLADPDGDGLSNLQEYQLGTDGFNPDSDGDGMPDGWEVTCSLDPLRDDSREDADGDDLLNVEEFEAATDPNDADSDDDGRSDYWEVKEAFSDPNVVDFDGNETLLATVPGNAFTNSGGGWDADGTIAYARSRAGWVEYGFSVAVAGVYQIEIDIEQRVLNASTDVFNLACHIDDALSASKRIVVNDMGVGADRYFTPHLGAGAHTVKFTWSNVYRNTTLQINAIKIYALSGIDSDNNGVPDWAETRLDNMGAVNLPETCLTSPVCVEGGNAAFIEQIAISGYYVPSGQSPVEPEIHSCSFNRWYADLPLDPDGITPVSVTVSYQNGAATATQNIVWEPVDLVCLDEITIRKNDSLLLTAILPDAYQGDYTVTVEEDDYVFQLGEVMPYKFETPGLIPIIVSWTPPGENELTIETYVSVVEASFNGDPICYVNTERRWLNTGIAEDTFVEADRCITITDLGVQGESRVFTLKSRTPAEGYVTARLYEDGPILDVARMVVIEATSHVNDGYHRIITDFGDGTVLYDGYLVVDRVVPDMEVCVYLWGTNNVFEDGTREKWFTAENFNAAGELHFNIIGGTYFTTCQGIGLLQNGMLVRTLQ